jgi:hypothetical protein
MKVSAFYPVRLLASVSALTVLLGLPLIDSEMGRKARPLAGVHSEKRTDAQKGLAPGDRPEDAEQFFRLKRAPGGSGDVPVERYLAAMKHAKTMRQHSTREDRFYPSEKELARDGQQELMSLGSWQQLGPGNIGGRVRAILINPTMPATMYAAGVAGGIWMSTTAGVSWAPIGDLLANIAVNSLAMDPANSNIIYAGTGEGNFNGDAVRGAGMFKTTDGGSSWTQLASTANSSFYYVNSIVISPNNHLRLYAGTRSGVWRSTDGGASWTQVLVAPPGDSGCMYLSIRIDQTADYVFASVGNFNQATIYRNTDAAGVGTWNPVLSEAGMGLTSLAIAPSNQAWIYAMSDDLGSGTYHLGLHAVFRSTDGGASWSARVRNTDATRLNTVLLTETFSAFQQECGFGGSDQFLNLGWYANTLAVDPLDANKIWAGGIDLFRSDDGGANWGLASIEYMTSGPNAHHVHGDQHVIVFHPQYNGTTNKTMIVGNDGGLFLTSDARAMTATGPLADCDPNNTSVPWSPLNNNFGVTQFYYGISYPDGTTYFGGTQDNGTVRGSDALGPNAWREILFRDGGAVAIDRNDTNLLYAESQALSIQRSTDGGLTWTSAISGIAESGVDFLFINPFVMDPTDASRLYTGGHFIWRTSDGAISWNQASAQLISASGESISALVIAPTNANMALAGSSAGSIFRTGAATTSNGGAVWLSTRPRSGYVAGLTFDPASASVAYAAYSTFNSISTDHHVYRSTDSGVSWAPIDGSGPNALPDIPVHCIAVDPFHTSTLYVGTDIGVFVSADGGASWARENTGFANVITEALYLNRVGSVTTLFAFTHGRGGWRVNLPEGPSPKRLYDFDGDGKADISIWRSTTGDWWIINSSDGSITHRGWGVPGGGDMPAPGDYDGDGKTDIAIWRSSTGDWWIINSSNSSITHTGWGVPGAGDIPVPGDYDGDGKTDISIWRATTGDWWILNSSDGSITHRSWGLVGAGDIPVPGDYDGDGKTDLAIWRASTGDWWILNSSDGSITHRSWGLVGAGDIPVPGDYDGDGKTDLAIWRATTGDWWILNSSNGSITHTGWGLVGAGDIPVPGDYDGDGKTDLAIWRASTGDWWILNSSNGSITHRGWGLSGAGDVPIPSTAK